MTFTELVAEVLGRDIAAYPPSTALADIGVTSKELVILLAGLEQELGCFIEFEVLAGLSTIASFEAFFDSARKHAV
jgi:acyl carrier protein